MPPPVRPTDIFPPRRIALEQQFTVLERDPVIAQDISETILELHQDPRIVLATTVPETCDAIMGQADNGGYAILNLTSDQMQDQRLIEVLRGRQVRTIVLHQPLTETPHADWTFLPPPFSTAQLQFALRQAAQAPTE